MVKYIPIKVPGKHPQTSELTTFELKGQHIELEEVVLIQAIKVFHQIPADGPLDGDHLRHVQAVPAQLHIGAAGQGIEIGVDGIRGDVGEICDGVGIALLRGEEFGEILLHALAF